jgi:hypothetical protein
MQRTVTVMFFIVFAAIAGLAQYGAPAAGGAGFGTAALSQLDGRTTTIVVVHPSDYPICPVGMHAQQGAGGDLLAVREGQTLSGPSQRIHLVLTQRHALQVTGARIRVRGLSGKNRIAEATATGTLPPDRTQTLNVTFTPGENAEVFADLVLAGFTSVQTIELQSVAYGDGSTWKMESSNGCKVTPDRVMRVAGR